jgi:hypothetical protein
MGDGRWEMGRIGIASASAINEMAAESHQPRPRRRLSPRPKKNPRRTRRPQRRTHRRTLSASSPPPPFDESAHSRRDEAALRLRCWHIHSAGLGNIFVAMQDVVLRWCSRCDGMCYRAEVVMTRGPGGGSHGICARLLFRRAVHTLHTSHFIHSGREV